jgi:hypothetical protein
MQRKAVPFRAWYYFRQGYTTYLAFLLTSVNTLVTVYYLAIERIPDLKIVFPTFGVWAAVMVVTVTPVAVLIGWLHFKRSRAYASEADVLAETNPYYYKLPPGYWREALAPAMLELLRLNVKILSKEQLSEKEIDSIKILQKKFEELIQGEFVGEPKRMGGPKRIPPQ